MSLSGFSDQFISVFNDYKVPEDSPLREILKKPIPTYEAAQQALQEIGECFRSGVEARDPRLVAKITPMLEAETARVQRAIAEKFPSQKSTTTIPPSLAMMGFEIAPDSDLSKEKPGSIKCTIDSQKVYLDREMIITFLLNKYRIKLHENVPDLFLGGLLEGMSNEVWKKPLTPKRVVTLGGLVSEKLKLLASNEALDQPEKARLFSMPNVQPSPGTTLPPVQQLVDTYRTRTWDDHIKILTLRGGEMEVGGYLAEGDDFDERTGSHFKDQLSFLQVVEAHNQQFAEPITQIKQGDEGYVEKLELKQGDRLYVRADLHSDLPSLLAQLDMLRESEDLDANYRCKEGFHMVFLGDYTDRGANDIEVLTLLLRLRMVNPTSVHLIRGNHEDVGMQMEYSLEGPWMSGHKEALSNCYKSMPLALCVTVKDESGGSQYVHFSHGAFSPAVYLAPLFESTSSGMVVRQNPLMTERKFRNKKEQMAFENLKEGLSEAAIQALAYTWSEVSTQRAPLGRAEEGTPEPGYKLSSEDTRNYGRYTGGGSPIKFFFHGTYT